MGTFTDPMNALRAFGIALICTLTLIASIVWVTLGPVQPSQHARTVFVVPEDDSTFNLSKSLFDNGLIRNQTVFWWFDFFYGPSGGISPGGYRMSSSMSAWDVVTVLHGKPQLLWVHVREGRRQEQIGEQLRASLRWSDAEWSTWQRYTGSHPEWEGTYFPGTYLFPTDEPATRTADMMMDEFRIRTKHLTERIRSKGLSWNTVLTIASLIQREAAGPHDMALISGIIWNRIQNNMRLDIDATLQYIKGNAEDGWWQRVIPDDKYRESPYNTYRTTGLPPYPIANPGLPAITAAINPEQTDCMFYLHDPSRMIHCSVTYTEHKRAIEKYLR